MKPSMSDEACEKAPSADQVLSLWFVKAGAKVAAVKLRSDRSVKDAVASTAKALKKRYEIKCATDARASRLGR